MSLSLVAGPFADGHTGRPMSSTSIKPELSSIQSALEDLTRRLDDLGRSEQREKGGEVLGAELLAVESTLRTGQRRLAKIVDRLR